MTWMAVAVTTFAVSTVAQFSQTRAAGAIAQGEAEVQAKAEELAATQREGDRKARLAEALASQNALAGSGGIAAFEGSPLTILKQDIKTEEKATERDKFQSQLGVMTTLARGQIARTQANTGANIGLIRQAGTAAGAAALAED